MLNGKPVTVIDCDDVVARCLLAMTREMNSKLGTFVTEDDVRTWDFHDTFGGEELKAHIHGKMMERGWCANLEVFPGAIEGVTRLREISEVFFCTAPFKGEHWPHERRMWLQEKFDLEHWRIIQASSKFLVRGDLFIDDKDEHLVEWEKYGEELGCNTGVAAIWDRPHNRTVKNFHRFMNWDEVYEYVRQGW